MKNTRWITKRLMKMTCRLHVGYEIVGYKKKMCVAVIPSILEAALAGVTPANNIGHRTKIAMDIIYYERYPWSWPNKPVDRSKR
eukprot:COSAG01_NODE_7717_length_3085_cov_5.519424_4_plen_84_part_00